MLTSSPVLRKNRKAKRAGEGGVSLYNAISNFKLQKYSRSSRFDENKDTRIFLNVEMILDGFYVLPIDRNQSKPVGCQDVSESDTKIAKLNPVSGHIIDLA